MSHDRMSPELRALLAQLPPGWEAWQGVNGLLYARLRKSSPPIVVRGTTADEVASKVRKQAQALNR